MTVRTAGSGIVIGRKGSAVKALRSRLHEVAGRRVSVDVQEVAHPELDAKLIAENVASQLERRVSPHRAMGRAMRSAMSAGAEGFKIRCKGRVYGSEMARSGCARGGCRCRHCGPTSTTPGGGTDPLRQYRGEDLGLQGADVARSGRTGAGCELAARRTAMGLAMRRLRMKLSERGESGESERTYATV